MLQSLHGIFQVISEEGHPQSLGVCFIFQLLLDYFQRSVAFSTRKHLFLDVEEKIEISQVDQLAVNISFCVTVVKIGIVCSQTTQCKHNAPF